MKKKKNVAPTQKSITQCLLKTSKREKLETAEVKLTWFLAEHSISIRATDHLEDIIVDIFEDSKTAKNMFLGRKKA